MGIDCFICRIHNRFLLISDIIPIAIAQCIILIVPVLYFLKLDYKEIFRKPSQSRHCSCSGAFRRIYNICCSRGQNTRNVWNSQPRNRGYRSHDLNDTDFIIIFNYGRGIYQIHSIHVFPQTALQIHKQS